MASLKHTVKVLQRMNSMSHVFFLVVLLVGILVAAVAPPSSEIGATTIV